MKAGALQITLSVLSWLPIMYLLLVLVAAMYDAFVMGVFTIMERDTDGTVLESTSRPRMEGAPNDQVNYCSYEHIKVLALF